MTPMINLASQPFRRERAQNAGLASVCVLLACTLVVLVSLIFHSRAQAADLRREIKTQNAELQNLQRQEAQFLAVVSKPQNADVFATSNFLNELIARRAVSWTRVFKDLDTVMPPNMKLIGLRLPQVGSDDTSGANHVQLDMLLGTDKPEAVLELLKRLESSNVFGSAQVLGQQPPTQNDPLYKFRVTVAYAQKI